jgi:transcription antitermination factor NusG
MTANTEITGTGATSIAGSTWSAADWPGLPMDYYAVRWYGAYTSANHEKRVAEQMSVRGLEHFLPLYECVRRWRNGRVTLQRPLFPGYVFVRMALRERLRVLQISGVARLVGFDGRPAALPDEEIESLRTGLRSGIQAEPHPYLTVGQRVRVKSGPLAGMEGILIRKKNRHRLVVSVDLILRSVAVEIERNEMEPI